ncbi:MAG: dUTP diphosphatase [Propionibacteriaceae bacterium]
MTEQPQTPGSTATVDGSSTAVDVDGADVEVPVALQQLDPDLPVPSYAHAGDAGADLRATADVTLAPGARALVGTGVAIALPRGYAGFVHPRSGLAARHGISILNAPGTLDADYRGEILVCVINLDPRTSVSISRGDRIAQLVVQPVSRARFVPVTELPTTVRGTDGHGSTGGIRHHPVHDLPTTTPRHSQELSG